MEQLNRVELIGHVGEVRITPVGNAKVANFSVRTEFAYKTKDGQKVIETCWHKVSAWAQTEAAAKYLERIKPECPVKVSGRIKVRTFVRQDGAQASLHEIAASRVEVLDGTAAPEGAGKMNAVV